MLAPKQALHTNAASREATANTDTDWAAQLPVSPTSQTTATMREVNSAALPEERRPFCRVYT